MKPRDRDHDGIVGSWGENRRRTIQDGPNYHSHRDIHGVGGSTDRVPAPRIGPPLSIADLQALPEPEERWLVEGWLPEDCNALWAGYPKTFKTLLAEELAVALVTATPFLGRFRVPEPRRVGLVLMEDARHRTRRRLERLAMGRGLALSDLDGLFLWFRPPLRLASAADLEELAGYVEEHRLDLLWVDSWSYVATGDSDDADVVTPQLQAFTRLRERRPGLAVGLTHHARKNGQDRGGDRLTDQIRNSSAFGAWYDVGVVLSRNDERSPVKVRSEMRDIPAPEPFMFQVEDQYPAGPDNGVHPTGWLRLQAMDGPAALMERETAWRKLLAPMRTFLAANPGCSKRELRGGIEGRNQDVDAAWKWLETTGEGRYDAPARTGHAGQCYLISPDRARPCPTVPGAHPGGTVPDRAPTPLKGGGPGHTPTPPEPPTGTGHGSDGFTCACGCGRDVGGPNVTRIECRRTA
jgi:hypothetical protein